MSTVYVVQEQPGKNLLPAEKYGRIITLLPSGMQVSFSAGQAVRQIDVKLSNFCDKDYLVLIGDPVCIGVAVALACKWNQGRAKLLKWDRQSNNYYPVSINLYEKEESHVKETF
jgi:hypothetical protein